MHCKSLKCTLLAAIYLSDGDKRKGLSLRRTGVCGPMSTEWAVHSRLSIWLLIMIHLDIWYLQKHYFKHGEGVVEKRRLNMHIRLPQWFHLPTFRVLLSRRPCFCHAMSPRRLRLLLRARRQRAGRRIGGGGGGGRGRPIYLCNARWSVRLSFVSPSQGLG